VKRLRVFIIPVVIAFAAGVLVRDLAQDWRDVPKTPARLSDKEEAYRAVLCPPGWKAQIVQRYDARDREGKIRDRVWIKRCV